MPSTAAQYLMTTGSSIRSFVLGAVWGFVVVACGKQGLVNTFLLGLSFQACWLIFSPLALLARSISPKNYTLAKMKLKDPRWRKYVKLYRQNREARFHTGLPQSESGLKQSPHAVKPLKTFCRNHNLGQQALVEICFGGRCVGD